MTGSTPHVAWEDPRAKIVDDINGVIASMRNKGIEPGLIRIGSDVLASVGENIDLRHRFPDQLTPEQVITLLRDETGLEVESDPEWVGRMGIFPREM
jgi:hypothetical protein